MNIIEIMWLGWAFIGGGVISYLIARYLLARQTISKQEFEKISFEKQLLEEKLIKESKIVDSLRQKLEISQRDSSILEYEKSSNSDLKQQISQMTKELSEEKAKVARLETERLILNEQRATSIKQIQEMQETFKSQFENLGNKIFKEHSSTFKHESQTRLDELLKPLKGDIDGFQKKLEDSFGLQSREQHSLKSEIERIVKINEQMTSQTNSLTKALKGDFRVQGNWGEVILERILEDSGLRAGEDYILQGSEMGIKHLDSGQTLKPDVVIKLPEDKHIIVDSKVSLTDYERFCATENEIERAEFLKQFLFSVKKHVHDLEERRYQDADKLKAPDFVLMFMPIEGAFSLAVQQDRELHSYAWGKKVVIVCPSTLFATLRTIASIWRNELQHRNALAIAKEGGLLYDKVFGFIEDMQKLGQQLKSSQDSHAAAMNKLCEGKGNILRKTEQLKILGAKAAKNLVKAVPEAFENLSEEESPDVVSERPLNEI
jgi:DNA recombination protein RmuC